MKKGYTLIELLVVIVVFAVIAFVSAETLILTLQSIHKTDNITKVRANIDYALGEMSRQLHNAASITSLCPISPSPANSVNFLDQNGNSVTFSCVNPGGKPSAIASSSASLGTNANLTSSDVLIKTCWFTCTQKQGIIPPTIQISVTATDQTGTNQISDETQITLRTY